MKMVPRFSVFAPLIVGLLGVLDATHPAAAQLPCQSVGGLPPSFTADNSYYCATYSNGLIMQDGFMSGNNDFGAGSQTHSQKMTVNPTAFPQGTSWTWEWPTPPQGPGISCCGVDSFYALYWGPAGYAVSAGPVAPTPTQLKAIKTLTTTFIYLTATARFASGPNMASGTATSTSSSTFSCFGQDPSIKYDPLFEIEVSLRDFFHRNLVIVHITKSRRMDVPGPDICGHRAETKSGIAGGLRSAAAPYWHD